MARRRKNLKGFFNEVWRRRVLQVAIPYGVAGWATIEVADLLLDAYDAPEWILRTLLLVVLGGFPVAVILAWIFDLTPKGTMVVTKSLEELEAEEAEDAPLPTMGVELGESERRRITVLSCDYEYMTEDNPSFDPEEMHETMTAFDAEIADLAKRFKAHELPSGSQELKLVFGYPQARSGDARRAVAAGMALIGALKKVAHSTGNGSSSGLHIRVGIGTGLVVVDESDEKGVKFVGQAPRLASWLESLATPDTLVIGERTRKLIKDHFDTEELGTFSNPQLGGDIEVHTVLEARTSTVELSEHEPLIGRQEEMHLLSDRWENVLEGEGEFALLRGEPGIGKSSLVRGFVHQVNDGEMAVIPCHCSPYETNNPLAPVIRMLQGPVFGFKDNDNSRARLKKLKRFIHVQKLDSDYAVPLLANLLSLDTGDEYEPLGESAAKIRLRTLELMLDTVAQIAAQRPVLMIYEDMHWADPSTLEMVQLLLDRGPVPGLMMLFTARPEFSAEWMKRSYVKVQDLQPLVKKSAKALIQTTAGKSELPDVICKRIVAETDGNPLFIQELTLAVLESDAWKDFVKRGGRDDLKWVEIPGNLQESLAARIDNLGAEGKALLQVCSVLGKEFSYKLLRKVSGTENESALREELTHIVEAELLFQRGVLRNQTFTFKHILIQETAYDSLLKGARKDLHGRTAEILENEFPEVAQREPNRMAYHYTEAGETDKAIAQWTMASRQSLTSFANAEAIEQARQGIALLEATGTSREISAKIIPLQSILGTALLSTYGYGHPEVQKAFTKALELCEKVGDAPELFRVVVGLWMYYVIAGEYDEALDLAQRLVRIAETTGNPAEFLQARYCLGYVLLYRAEFRAARSHLEEAIESESPDCNYQEQSASGDDTRIHVRSVLAIIMWHLGHPREAVRLSDEAKALAIKVKHPYGKVFAEFGAAWLHQLRGDPELTLKNAQSGAVTAEEKGINFFLVLNRYMMAWATGVRPDGTTIEDGEDSLVQMNAMLEHYRAIGSAAGESYLFFIMIERYIDLGRLDEARDMLHAIRDMMDERQEFFEEPEYYRLLGMISLRKFEADGTKAELDAAESHFADALNNARHHESKGLELKAALDLADALCLQGNQESAKGLLAGINQRIEEPDTSRDFVRIRNMLKKLSTEVR